MKFTTFLFPILLLSAHQAIAQDIEEILDVHKYGWRSDSERLSEREQLPHLKLAVDEYNKQALSVSGVTRRSMLYPGLGQFKMGSGRKGWLFLVGETASLTMSAIFYASAQSHYNEYKKARNINRINDEYDLAQSRYKSAQIMFAVAVGIWTYNIFDANRGASKHNRNLFERLVGGSLSSPQSELQWKIIPEGDSVRLSMEVKF